MSTPKESIRLDPKTAAVFRKKGYSVDKKLNEGAFGQVYKGSNTKTGELVAVKVMDLDKVGDKFKQKFLPRELAALIGIKHESVICIHDIIRANHKIYIFMEFANGGDITGYLHKNGSISEPLACYWFTQVSNALSYIHDELKIAHRDIKIDNILLHDNMAKLTDFGFAKESYDCHTDTIIMSETFCGTEPYYSPQIVARKPYNAFAADVWAMGVTLFCMLNNKFPFHFGDSKKMLIEQTDRDFIKTRYVKRFPSDLRNFQEKFFVVDETIRWQISEVFQHPWILRKGR
ncbi:testis-specific serine/threonine-protein kinase 4 [Dermatophagoides farinae]|mgnify:CR=1 FL=1|uniref:Protein serine threonine kinase n=1 Tax=Dermatophagoides farinae TaxID=6954 RepID=A0A922HTP6_DERFA|nr:testis-specific serine/threonine-protein kinase 4-like [Dermatophagoides farinae]KAH7637751.1 serine/threonine protein kinase-like protein [Dermatophagoides farinae]KAH9501727.1 protein serine threonine kinase [Dermatophagoides farinae]